MSTGVVCVTLNAAIDQTVLLEKLSPGSVQRALSARVDAGGKGINVASCLADWGIETLATGLLGADNTAVFEHLFEAKGIEDRCVRVRGETRTNIKLVDTEAGTTTDINLPGLHADDEALRAVCRALQPLCEPQRYVVMSGSLPHGLTTDAWRPLLTAAAKAGCRVVLDTSGAALQAALRMPRDEMPYAVKPNRHELEAWIGRPLPTRADVLEAARALQHLGIAWVLVSLGEDGALLLHGDEAVHAQPPALQPGSTVGAGDAMVAGLVSALLSGSDIDTAARLATAFAAGKLGRAGPNLPSRERVATLAQQTVLTRLS